MSPVAERSAEFSVQVDVAAGLERTWRAFTEPGEIIRWLAPKADIRAEAGGPYELFWEPARTDRNSTLGCRVTAAEPPSRIEFEWRGPEAFADLMNARPFPTKVAVELAPAALGRTAIRLVHSGWGEGPRWAQARDWQEGAWRDALERLIVLLSCGR